jgi:uncharacterized protein (DUF2236 family)
MKQLDVIATIGGLAGRTLHATPARGALDTFASKAVRAGSLPGVQFTDPPGDPGWFGPDSSIWYVHSHLSVGLGGVLGLWMEAAHPVLARGVTHHSVMYRTDASWDTLLHRLGQSASFINAVTFGSTEVAEQSCKIVRAMHTKVRGTLPNGLPYAANDPEPLRFAYANLSYGMALAHLRYHPAPLGGSDLDQYFAEWAVIAEALGAVDLPKTLQGVEDYFHDMVPSLALTEDALRLMAPFEGKDLTGTARVTWSALKWIWIDLMPEWSRRIYRYPQLPSVARRPMRAAVRTAIIAAHDTIGGSAEHQQALARVTQRPGPRLTSVSA